MYVGINESGEIDWGIYATGTGLLSSSAGWDIGGLFAWGDIYTNQLEGYSYGFYGGLDTPVVDVMYGVETLPDGAKIHNLTLTVGPEPSVGGPIGSESNINITKTVRLN